MMSIHRWILPSFCWVAGALCACAPVFAQIESIEAVTRSPKPESAGESSFVELGDDPRWAIFASDDNVYTPGDDNAKVDLFLRDISAKQNILVSRGLSGGGANGHSTFPFLSTEGRWVVFESDASNLVEGDTNEANDVFLFERETGRISLVSQTAQSGRQGAAGLMAVTPDAKFVVFHSSADDLVDNDTNGAPDLFLWNRETKALQLLTKFWDGERSSTNVRAGPPLEAAISQDGGRVAFIAFPSDMAPEGTYGATAETWAINRTGQQLFLWDSTSQSNRVITPLSVTAEPAGYSYSDSLVMSANGERLVFWNETRYTNQNLPSRKSWWAYSVPQQRLEEISLASTNSTSDILADPVLNADGSLLAYSLDGQIALHDFATGSNRVVSATAQGGPGGSRSYAPMLSGDGNTLLFLSDANELVPTKEFYQMDQLLRYDRTTGALELAVRSQGGSGGANADLFFPTLRGDGRAAGFITAATNISGFDTGGRPQAYAIDLTGTNEPVLISEPLPEQGSATASGASLLDAGAMSLDGRFVAFVSAAQLTEEDTNATYDLYLRDLPAGETRLLSFPIEGATRSEFVAFNAMSADGALVLYTARQYFMESNITAIVASRPADRSINPVSVLPNGSLAATATAASLSADGNTLAFVADGRAYVRTLPNGVSKAVGTVSSPDIVLSPRGNFLLLNSGTSIREIYSLQTGQLRTVAGAQLTDSPFSADDRRLLTMQRSGVNARLFVTDTATFLSNLVAESISGPATMSADGSRAFYAKRTGTNTDLYVHDLATGAARPLLLDGKSIWPRRAMSTSANGRYLALALTNTVAPDSSVLFHQLHVFDLWRTNSFLLSRSLAGAAANGPSSSPCLSADGRIIAFDSTGSDLVPNDRNGFSDVFVARLTVADTNANGIEDGWEQKHLPAGANAGDDPDEDGATNLQEFLAGTDPTSAASVLTITRALVASEPRSIQIFWNGVWGRSYRVQHRASLSDGAWSDLSETRVATGNGEMAHTQPLDGSGGFFRVVPLP